MQGLKTVRLLGSLGKKFGRTHRFAISSPAEAIRALKANCPGFEKELLSSESRNVRYKVLVGKTKVESTEELRYPSGRGVVTIAPVLVGAGGVGQFLAGAALLAASVFIPGSATLLGVGIASTLGTVGVALALGGVTQMLAPQPPAPESPKERPENNPSYLFDGPVNTIAQGHPVPIGYGRLVVGSQVISAGVEVQNIDDGESFNLPNITL